VDNAAFGRTAFSGITLTGTHQLLGKYTYKGDANLDGKVTGDDYAFFDANLGLTSPTVQWNQGDFNLDDKDTGDDYAFIEANLGKGSLTPLTIIEPSTPTVTTTEPALTLTDTSTTSTLQIDSSNN